MAANLTGQVRAIAEVTTAVARGDLSKKIDVDVKGTRSLLFLRAAQQFLKPYARTHTHARARSRT